MTGTVLQTFPLGPQWPTVDPFLFCAHHDDAYPAGDGALAPAVALTGRDIGQDFSAKDGWSMYHGSTVPGFPQHPHRGFETVTLVRKGLCDHADSLGALARFGEGDAQWITAGAGIVHSEMFPLLSTDGPNPLELFQIWVNLPAADKMTEPHFTMLWADQIPKVASVDDHGRSTTVTVVAGRYGDTVPPSPPPPESWASDPAGDVAIWVLTMEPGARTVLPAAGPDTLRVLYVFEGPASEGPALRVDGEALPLRHGAVVRCADDVELVAGTGTAASGADGPVQVLVLQGRPIGEPVARYGPFVMNTEDEIHQAFEDYRRTGFGGWPWAEDGPAHGHDPQRFARYPDGRTEQAGA
ncbi:MAG: pirin family protein [Actinomycetes bacterium]